MWACRQRRLDSGIRSTAVLETIELETGPAPTGSVIWLHGLGADGHDFEPLVPELVRPGERALRFVFPHAPLRPVTINGGYAMRAWYDITSLERDAVQDKSGIRAAHAAVDALIEREIARGVASTHIVLAGFSQGGAIAVYAGTRYPQALSGIIGLSCYMLLGADFAPERAAANRATPVLLAHGSEDPVVSPALGAELRQALESAGQPVEWHSYPMPHAVCNQEIAHIAAWLRRVL
jgi:phospholipase/carboxylesterase